MASTGETPTALRRSLTKNPTLNLLTNLTLREIRAQYKRTALGRIWSLINPLATLAIYSVVFGILFKSAPPVGANSGLNSFVLWMACGLIPWMFMSNAIIQGMGALQANSGLLTKVYFPRHVLVTSSVLGLATTFLTELVVLLVIMTVAGGPRVLLYIPILIVVVLLNIGFALGIALGLSVAVAYFGDIQHLWGLFNQVWFYASGVLFPLSIVAGGEETLRAHGWHIPLVKMFEVNPAFEFITAYRSVLYDFAIPSPMQWLSLVGWTAGTLLVGAWIFQRFQGRVVEEL